MKTPTEIKFDQIIKQGFHEILEPRGFKKRSNNFYLQLQDLGQIINIQKSSWGSKDRIRFTINTGIFVPEYWRGLQYNYGKEIPVFPTEPECLIRKRIGNLRKQHDTWYDLIEKTNEGKLINEMKENLEKHILPYFETVKTKQAFIDLIDKEKLILAPLGKLVLYGELKQFEKAKSEYINIITAKCNPDFLITVKEYGKKYQLD